MKNECVGDHLLAATKIIECAHWYKDDHYTDALS